MENEKVEEKSNKMEIKNQVRHTFYRYSISRILARSSYKGLEICSGKVELIYLSSFYKSSNQYIAHFINLVIYVFWLSIHLSPFIYLYPCLPIFLFIKPSSVKVLCSLAAGLLSFSVANNVALPSSIISLLIKVAETVTLSETVGTSAPIGAFKPFLEIMTDRPTDRQTDRIIGKFHLH